MRLDEALVARGLVASRARARDLVRRGLVQVCGKVVTKPAYAVRDGARLELAAGAPAYVSRGAEKLVAALDAFALDPAGRTALDIGASTGGFTDVLLRRGAVRVYAVDVGRGQLAPRLAADPRVVALQETDARRLDRALVREPIGCVVADASFISLTLALPAALALSAPGAWLAALIKPQFEAGRAAVGKGGIVRDARDREAAVARVREWLAAQPGWRVLGVMESPILGGSGNAEHLIGAVRDVR
jgi:23S rRNA (cytidine1920-2'-O)/16S rRNA (cytidine1409-2'-O)-methyltransferase